MTQLGYDDGGKLYSVSANVRGAITATDFVTSIEYDARGQRQRIEYGNDTRTTYEHDPLTFRLRRLHTTNTAETIEHQDLRYTYDPVGNITEIRDLAQPVVFTSNAAVSADQRFTYDALYRLIEAEGREHGSQGQRISDDFTFRAAPDDPTGLRAYTEGYAYDLVGNILEVQHQATSGNWTRRYQYATDGNRLLATSAPGDGPGVYSHEYEYDAHGSMTAMPHLAEVAWDHADRMQSADLGGGGTVWFLYDSAGNRVRKIRVNLAGTSTYERIYVGGYEVYRERVSGDLELERQTLHVADDTGRICLVETKTVEDGDPVTTPANISRYQYGNHLGSVGMELDETGQLISYEEFHPYGTSAYRAANSAVDVSPSRYRYTGKERDEETGLGHHGARYYASWLGRWTAADPIGLGDGPNRYRYARNRPPTLYDPNGMIPPGDLPHTAQFEQAGLQDQSAAPGNAAAVASIQPGADLLQKWVDDVINFDPEAGVEKTLKDPVGTALDSSLGVVVLRDTIRQTEEAIDTSADFIEKSNELEAAIRSGENVLNQVQATAESAGRAVVSAFSLGFGVGSARGKTRPSSASRKITSADEKRPPKKTVFRALNSDDAANIEAGKPLQARGQTMGDQGIALQTQGEKRTGMISAADKLEGAQKFEGPDGIIEIDVETAIRHGSGFVDHPSVLRAIQSKGLDGHEQDLKNAIAAFEVMFKKTIPLESIVRRFSTRQ